MGGGQTKVYTPGSGDDDSLPSKDANETPLIRLVNLVHYLDHHVPADNAKCRAALVEIMGIIKTYRDHNRCHSLCQKILRITLPVGTVI